MDRENSMETIRHLENMTWYEKLDESDLFGREEKTGDFLLLDFFSPLSKCQISCGVYKNFYY